jgi:spermidine/putrescine transport system permease protein
VSVGEQSPSLAASAVPRRASRGTEVVPALLAAPLALWLLALVAAPGVVFVLYSFWRVEGFQIVRDFSFDNYREIRTGNTYASALVDSLLIGATTAAVTCVLGFALAWAIRFHVPRGRDLLLLVIVISSIGSYLARLYAWRSILGGNGIINYTLERVGLVDQPLDWLIFNRFAVIVTLTNVFLPFAFLPIYANLLSIRPDVLEAGRVLGAGPFTNFRRVILPLASTGLAVSFIYVLIFATGDFATPQFLGGPTGGVVANLIETNFGRVFDWPLGAAMSLVYMAVLGVIAGLLGWYVARRTRRLAA